MFTRALIAFFLLPGIVTFVIPAAWIRYFVHMKQVHPFGLVPFALGLVALLLCVRGFYVEGAGTLAPWAPTRKLVTVGLYRYSRNPMYVSVALILLGWSIFFYSMGLLAYTILIVVIFHLRIVLGEEPWLAQTYGTEWESYCRRVPRWF